MLGGVRISLTSPVVLLFTLVVYFIVNGLTVIWPTQIRLDLTQHSLYTLSGGTHKLLARIEKPMTLHYFFSQRLAREVPLYRSHANRVRTLLMEIESLSNEKVILLEHDPEPFSDAEDTAVSYGIQGIPIDQGEEMAYFGLAGVNSQGETKTIPFFQPKDESLLEYDLMETIQILSNDKPPGLGVMSSLPLLGDMGEQINGNLVFPWAISKRLRSKFRVMNLPQSIDHLPRDLAVLMVVHPQTLNERTLYQLEQFLFRGGRVVFFIDPKSESDYSGGPDLVSSSASGVDTLFQHWGIRIPPEQLVGDKTMALRVNAGTPSQPVPAEYLVWLDIPSYHMNQDDPVSSRLSNLNFATAGAIDINERSPLDLQPLVYSSKNSGLIPVEQVSGLRPDILGLLDRFEPDLKIHVMAARLSGKLSTAFPLGATSDYSQGNAGRSSNHGFRREC
ncbi:MAG: hypothetical protein GKR95_23540 [Gammaproteobacteria bacterium]|nr:hypothetical protein [Gammaproteobacteria bacterium]